MTQELNDRLNETRETFAVDAADPGAPQLEARLGEISRTGRTSQNVRTGDGPDAEPAAVVAPPHPMMGGSLDNPVVESLARGLAAAGCRTLRFNWRGVGASTGAASGDLGDALADYRAALQYLASLAPSLDASVDASVDASAVASVVASVVAAGYSFGAVAAVNAAASESVAPAGARVRVCRLVLVAPPLAMIDLPELSHATIPVHVIVGDRDEYAPVATIEARLEGLDAVRLDVVDGADHFFSTGDPRRLASLVAAGMMNR